MSRKRKKVDQANYIYGIEAAKILGISRITFYKRIKLRKYENVSMVKNRVGVKYLIQDVFRIAHPSADDKLIESMVYNHNLKKMLDTKKRGRKK